MLNVGSISESSAAVATPAASLRRFLHLTPTLTLFRSPLWRPYAVRGREVGISVDLVGASSAAVSTELRPRRIYPNRAYLVAGSSVRKQGVIVDILPGVEHVRAQYLWTFPERFGLPRLKHILEIELRECSGNWFSTYAVNWPREAFALYLGSPSPLFVNPVTHVDHAFSSYGDHRHVELGLEDGVRVVRERLTLFGRDIKDLPCLDSFEK